MTEGQASNTLFLIVLQILPTRDKNYILDILKECNIKLTVFLCIRHHYDQGVLDHQLYKSIEVNFLL